MRPAEGRLWFGLIGVVGAVADLLTKHYVFAWRGLPGQKPVWWLWEGFAGIETSLNTGALFGLGQGQVAFFAVFSVIALLGILYWLLIAGAQCDRFLAITLGLISGGVVGNLWDRLGLWSAAGLPAGSQYAVRDWIRLSYGPWVWPNFNIADALLVCGALLLIGYSFWCSPSDTEDASHGSSPQESGPPA